MFGAEAGQRGLEVAIANRLQLLMQDPQCRAQQHGGEHRRQPAAPSGLLAGHESGTHVGGPLGGAQGKAPMSGWHGAAFIRAAMGRRGSVKPAEERQAPCVNLRPGG